MSKGSDAFITIGGVKIEAFSPIEWAAFFSEEITEEQLKEIKQKNFIPDGYLKAYLHGKSWCLCDKDGQPTVNTSEFNFK